MRRVIARRAVQAAGGRQQPGDTLELPDRMARRYTARGYVTPVPASKPATAPSKGLSDLTVDELRKMAAEREVAGRSSMTKDELVEALSE